jgi:hypothetical protein
MGVSAPAKELVTLRVPRALVDEVRTIAERESESQSTVLRRLLRKGLSTERRSHEAVEAFDGR